MPQAHKAFAASDVDERLGKQGLRLPLGTPEEFAALIAADSARWDGVIQKADIRLESN